MSNNAPFLFPQYSATSWGMIGGTLNNQTDLKVTLDGKADNSHNHDGDYEPANINIQSHISDTNNPHAVTKAQVGLSEVDNTSDIDKPVSDAAQTVITELRSHVEKIENNLVLETFRRMNADAQTGIDYFQDGWVDDLQDDTNIDSGLSSNYSYDSAGDYVTNSESSASAFSNALTIDDDFANTIFAVRQKIPSSAITPGGQYVQIRVNSSAAYAMNMVNCFIGYAATSGNAWDFESTPTRVTFGNGNNGVSILQNANAVSDKIKFLVESGKNLLLSFDFSSTGQYVRAKGSQTNYTTFYKIGVSNEAGIVAPSGYGSLASYLHVIDLVTSYNANNMTLVFDSFTSEEIPIRSKSIAILEYPCDNVTVGTDIEIWASVDNGSNYVKMDIADEGLYETARRIVAGDVDIVGATTKVTRLKVLSKNNKYVKVHAISNLLK